MAAVAKKCYYANTSKIILFDFYCSTTPLMMTTRVMERAWTSPATSTSTTQSTNRGNNRIMHMSR